MAEARIGCNNDLKNQGKDCYYVSREEYSFKVNRNVSKYLHSDGIWRRSTS